MLQIQLTALLNKKKENNNAVILSIIYKITASIATYIAFNTLQR